MANPIENCYSDQYKKMLLRYGNDATVSDVYQNLFRLCQVACLNTQLNEPEAYHQAQPTYRNSDDKLNEIFRERVDEQLSISYLEESKDKPAVALRISAILDGTSPNCTIRQSPINQKIMLELGSGRSRLDPQTSISELWDKRDVLPSDIYRLLTINRVLRERLKNVCRISSHARNFINSNVVPRDEPLAPSMQD